MLRLLQLWIDPVPRDGPENMAIDEWLAETAEVPVLRSYRWTEGWGSFGYFVKAADLPEKGLRWVRRWTGGGIVDHRADWTYTLFVPRGFGLAEAKGGESYRAIHAALAGVLRGDASLSAAGPAVAGGECFIRPVEHDVLDASGRKIAGAGQRRTIRGLLHQGSVSAGGRLPKPFANALADRIVEWDAELETRTIRKKIASRYGCESWTRGQRMI